METSHVVDFRKVVKGCGLKYRNKVLRKALQAMLGYCPQGATAMKVEISDETGFCQVFSNMKEAAETSGISNGSAIKLALSMTPPL